MGQRFLPCIAGAPRHLGRPQLCPPGCAQTREQKKEKSRCQVKLSLLWKWGLAGKPCWVFLIPCAQTASMEGMFSAKPLLGHARPDSLRPCYLTRVHPVSQCLALHQDLGPEAGGSSPSLSMVVFYLRLINYYCWTILYFPNINFLFLTEIWAVRQTIHPSLNFSRMVIPSSHGGGLAVVFRGQVSFFYLWTVNYNSLVNTRVPRRI